MYGVLLRRSRICIHASVAAALVSQANTEEFGGSKSVLLLNGKQKAGDSLTAAL